jgi:hypothetical protein
MSENSGVSLVGNPPAIDLPGVYLLSGFFGAAVLYIAYCFLRRARLGSAKRTIYAGAFRLAAARGDLPALVFLSEQGKGCDVHSEITGFTPLHAAAAQKQAGTGCRCAGADHTYAHTMLDVVRLRGWLHNYLTVCPSSKYDCRSLVMALSAGSKYVSFKGRRLEGHCASLCCCAGLS